MTLNGIMIVILRYFSEFSSFWLKVVEDAVKLSETEM